MNTLLAERIVIPQNCIEKYMFDYEYQRSSIKVYDKIYKLADKKE